MNDYAIFGKNDQRFSASAVFVSYPIVRNFRDGKRLRTISGAGHSTADVGDEIHVNTVPQCIIAVAFMPYVIAH